MPPHTSSTPSLPAVPTRVWDVFCRVIDNFGDIGVCWRLCADLAARGHRVRLWVDDASALQWMAPPALQGQWEGVQVLDWNQAEDSAFVQRQTPGDVWIEGFGCELPEVFVAEGVRQVHARLRPAPPVWVNLEYLSAEDYVARSHGLASPLMSGAAQGWRKFFYFPGFTPETGGLLRESHMLERQSRFDAGAWLQQWGVQRKDFDRIASLFCYEPAALSALLDHWSRSVQRTCVLVTAGRASVAVRSLLGLQARDTEATRGNLRLVFLPSLMQQDFDHLLWSCDFNAVRGEDSLVRALWAGKPLLWQLYPQSDDAHHAKLEAFLDVLQADAAQRELHRVWNGASTAPMASVLDHAPWLQWAQHARVMRAKLLEIPDLTSALVAFVQKNR